MCALRAGGAPLIAKEIFDCPNYLTAIVSHITEGAQWAHNDSKSRAIRVAGCHIGPGPFVEDWVRIYIASNDVLLVLPRSPSEVGS